MQIEQTNDRFARFITLATFVLVVAVLRAASEVMVPIALSVLLAFLLSPLVARLMRWGAPKIAAVLLTAVLAFSVICGVSWVLSTQAISLFRELPKYDQNIHRKIENLKKPHGSRTLARSTEMIENLRKELFTPDDDNAPDDSAVPRVPKPAQVEVVPPKATPLELADHYLGPVLKPLGTAGIVIIFVIAMLFQREDLRERFIKVVSAGKLNIATQAVDDAARRVSRFLAMQLMVNTTYGVLVGLGLSLIGIPNALLWGLLSTLLRFIPFLGAWIAASLPLILAIAVDPGWSKFISTGGLFIAAEILCANFIEPMLYGASTGISNFALIVATVFWTWLWGTPGLFLATPLTVCLMVLGRYVPGVKFLSVLLSSGPVMEPPTQLYQRMLSMDFEPMLDLSEKYVEQRSLEEFYDRVFIPALIMAEEDRSNGTLAEVRQKFIFQSSRELIEEFEHRDRLAAENDARIQRPSGPAAVLGIAARDDTDEIAARMLRHLLRRRGLAADVNALSQRPEETLTHAQPTSIKIAYVSALPPSAVASARKMTRRLREECHPVRVVVGVWGHESPPNELKQRLGAAHPDDVATTLMDAVLQIEKWSKREGTAPADLPVEAKEPPTEIKPLGLVEVEPEELFDTVTRELAEVFQVPISLVSIVDSDRPFWQSHLNLPPEVTKTHEAAPREAPLKAPAVLTGDLLVVEDVTKDKRFETNPFLHERGLRFYAGAPLRTHGGHIVGSLCVVDTKPRQISERQKNLLRARAAELMEVVETRHDPTPASRDPFFTTHSH